MAQRHLWKAGRRVGGGGRRGREGTVTLPRDCQPGGPCFAGSGPRGPPAAPWTQSLSFLLVFNSHSPQPGAKHQGPQGKTMSKKHFLNVQKERGEGGGTGEPLVACVWGADLARLHSRGQGGRADSHSSLCSASTPLVLGTAPQFSFGKPHLPSPLPPELHGALEVGRRPNFGQRGPSPGISPGPREFNWPFWHR